MTDLAARYNYDRFVPEKYEQWLNFDVSPKTGTIAPDFPLWRLDETEVRLGEVLAQKDYTIIEFGSFT